MTQAPEMKTGGPREEAARNIPKRCGQSTVSNDRFNHEFLDGLRARLPDYLAARGIELRKRGTRLLGLCPVHEDRSPSFAVFGSNHETAGCHPCGFSGDVFAVSQWLGRAGTFPEAVRDVAAVLGAFTPEPSETPAKRKPRAAVAPFTLTASDEERIHRARLAFSDAWHGGDPIIDGIAASLGIDKEALRHAAWGASGLGLSAGRFGGPLALCFAYPTGLNWRNPRPGAKPRFDMLCGRATAPWRAEWITPDITTVYLTESETDCLALIAAGVETDGKAVAVASPGTSFLPEWAGHFRGKRVILCFDSDKAGRDATAKTAAMLQGIAAEVLTWKGTHRHE